MDNKFFTEKLIIWYNKNQRDLPWRKTRDPFKIWLSEVILQQTRVAQGLPYYLNFTAKFNSVEDLAHADEQQVLRLWQGLGYYSRARNLHRCAKIVAKNFSGKFPKDYKSLLKLPGIGKYTAAAIASFAYREKVPAIDGNVYRVLSRVLGIQEDIATGAGQKAFEAWATQMMADAPPDIYNQAIMEFGAIHCTPKAPDCSHCVFNIECYARQHGLQDKLPVKSKKIKITNRYLHYIVLRHGNKTAMKKRSENDIWKGLYDYMMVEAPEFKDFDWLAANHTALEDFAPYIKNLQVSPDYKHVLTHRKLYARFFSVELDQKAPVQPLLQASSLQLFDDSSVHQLPKPVLVSRYLNDTNF